jgi:succinate dehydrogenase / fumarate reductase cytochrome b subunit
MSLTGLFLCIFLLEHVIGNLLILKNDAGSSYDAFSEFMAGNPIIRTIELVLFGSLFLHAFSGISVWLKNRRARPIKYEAYKLGETTQLASRIMMTSAIFVVLFLVVHLNAFFIKMRFGGEHVSGYQLVREEFSHTWFSLFYLFSFILIAFHLYHGFQSAFQTLGLKTKKYSGIIEAIAVLFWLVIPLGFAVIPVYFLFFHQNIALAQ